MSGEPFADGRLPEDEIAAANVPVERKAGPTTEAMRLRPRATRPGAPTEVARERNAGAIDALETTIAERDEQLASVARALAELLELHTPSPLVPMCRECLMPAPCPTRRLLEVVAGTTTPPEEGSQ